MVEVPQFVFVEPEEAQVVAVDSDDATAAAVERTDSDTVPVTESETLLRQSETTDVAEAADVRAAGSADVSAEPADVLAEPEPADVLAEEVAEAEPAQAHL